MSRQPVLGSAAIYTPQRTLVHVSESTCLQLSLFKDVMREYRKLDDTVTMRMNRNGALFRDRNRQTTSSTYTPSDAETESCAYFWKELVANWRTRAEILDYCVSVVDARVERAKAVLKEDTDPEAVQGVTNGVQDRDHREAITAEKVRRDQIRNERVVEKIVRRRTYDAFRTRCKFYEPPPTDIESRRWWEAASNSFSK